MNEISIGSELMREFGPLVTLIVYYIWRDFVTSKQNALREVRLYDRVTQLEDYQRNELTNTIVLVTKALHDFADAVKTRPCLLHEDDYKTAKVRLGIKKEE